MNDFKPFAEPLHYGRVLYNSLLEMESFIDNIQNHCEQTERKARIQLRLFGPQHDTAVVPTLVKGVTFLAGQIYGTPMVAEVLMNRVVEYRKKEKDYWRPMFKDDMDLLVKRCLYVQKTYDVMLKHFHKMTGFMGKYAHRQMHLCEWLAVQVLARRAGLPHHHSPMKKFLDYNGNNLRLKFGRIRAEIARAKINFETYGPRLSLNEMEERKENEPIAERLRSKATRDRIRAEPVCKRLRSSTSVANRR